MAKVCKRRGRYVLDFYDQHGERQRLTMPEGTTKKEADRELDDYKDQVRKGTYVSDRKVPLFSDVAMIGFNTSGQISEKQPGRFMRAM